MLQIQTNFITPPFWFYNFSDQILSHSILGLSHQLNLHSTSISILKQNSMKTFVTDLVSVANTSILSDISTENLQFIPYFSKVGHSFKFILTTFLFFQFSVPIRTSTNSCKERLKCLINYRHFQKLFQIVSGIFIHTFIISIWTFSLIRAVPHSRDGWLLSRHSCSLFKTTYFSKFPLKIVYYFVFYSNPF